MTCYIVKPRKASHSDYQAWLAQGFNGSYYRYLEMKRGSFTDGPIFVCGNLGPHCTECAAPSEVLCDYPVGEGKTCDRPMCADHAHHVMSDTDYCPDHFREWEAFRASDMRAAITASLPITGLQPKADNEE